MIGALGRISGRLGLYRNTQRGWIGGVCAGIADRLGVRCLWIRLPAALLAAVTHFVAAIVIYALAVVVLKRQPGDTAYFATPGLRPKPAASGNVLPPSNAHVADIKTRFTALNARLNRIEAAVTSDELSLRRKFRDLGG